MEFSCAGRWPATLGADSGSDVMVDRRLRLRRSGVGRRRRGTGAGIDAEDDVDVLVAAEIDHGGLLRRQLLELGELLLQRLVLVAQGVDAPAQLATLVS